VGQRVFGLADWARNGSLAEYAAVETRNLAPLPIDIDHTVAAALPISGLSAWQGLFDHGRLSAGQTVLIHGAAGGVGSIAVQLAREVGARVIGTGRTADRDRAVALGVHTFLDLETEKLEDAGEVDVVFDVIGGDILARSAALVRAGGTLVTIAEPPKTRPRDGRAMYLLVEPDRARLADLAARVRDGRLKPVVGAVLPLAEAAAALTVSYPPGGRSAAHHHARSAFIMAYVMSGAIRSQLEGEPARVYHAGETWSEDPGAHHTISENASATEPAELLAVFLLDTGDGPLTTDDTANNEPPR
jgi:NADPH:quinone reductase-like Zn-dependent oxidoreductase